MALVGQLIILEGKDVGKKHVLDQRHVFEVGRASSSSIRLDSTAVAMNHCRIYREEGNVYTLYDLNSGMGTSINGQKVEKQELKHGDKVAVGDYLFDFLIEDIEIKEYVDADVDGFSLDWGQPDGSVARSEQYVEVAAQEQPVAQSAPTTSAAVARGRLTALEGEDKGKEFYLDQDGTYTIGRALDAQIKIMDIKASRAHCLVEKIGNLFFVADNSSRNGTFLNGQKLQKKSPLLPDAYVKVGFTVFKFDIIP